MMTVTEFFRRFPDEETCLEHLWNVRYGNPIECPKCAKQGDFYKLRKIPAWACPRCGHHIHPMQGTPFARTRTPLQKWFYAMYLFTTTRHGVSAKELQRQLGVTYKTAWRMGHELRKYMGIVDGDPPLGGVVEADEVYIGGKKHGKRRSKGTTGRATIGKTAVLGIYERGGPVMTHVIKDASTASLVPPIVANVEKGSTIHTDEWHPYKRLAKEGYTHQFVSHRRKEYVRGSSHTNSLDGFWALFKRSVRGTHVWISSKHVEKYLGEFEFRHNMRHTPEIMFDRLLFAF